MTAERAGRKRSRGSLMSVVDSREVSNREERERLAGIIRHNRALLARLLGLTENTGCSGWTEIQKAIPGRLRAIDDPLLKERAEACAEELLDAEAELLEGNLRLVLMVVRRYSRSCMGALEEMDLVQEGCEGLLDAVRRFDFRSGKGFLSYALIRIRRNVLLAIEKQQRLVRVPGHLVRKSMRLMEAVDSFASQNGRYPGLSELEGETGGSVDWSILLSFSERVLSLHEPAGEPGIPLEEKLSLGDTRGGTPPELRELLEEALAELDKRAKFVIVMRYGLFDGEPQKLATVAEILGLSTERTRQIEKAAVKKLADALSGVDVSCWLQQG
jgi:RNA polymerase primary sigma factor